MLPVSFFYAIHLTHLITFSGMWSPSCCHSLSPPILPTQGWPEDFILPFRKCSQELFLPTSLCSKRRVWMAWILHFTSFRLKTRTWQPEQAGKEQTELRWVSLLCMSKQPGRQGACRVVLYHALVPKQILAALNWHICQSDDFTARRYSTLSVCCCCLLLFFS